MRVWSRRPRCCFLARPRTRSRLPAGLALCPIKREVPGVGQYNPSQPGHVLVSDLFITFSDANEAHCGPVTRSAGLCWWWSAAPSQGRAPGRCKRLGWARPCGQVVCSTSFCVLHACRSLKAGPPPTALSPGSSCPGAAPGGEPRGRRRAVGRLSRDRALEQSS